MFTLLLYTSLTIFILGLIYKISTWFTRKIGICARDITTSERIFAAFRGIGKWVFSSKILILVKVFVLDVLLQKRIARENLCRWLMHMLIFSGFVVLLLMHALDDVISESLFKNYYPTVNPFLFLRDFFGLIVIAGLGVAVYRRFILKASRLRTNRADRYAIIILAVIMVSGVLLEGTKIISHTEFQEMVSDWSDPDDEDEVRALEALWVADFGVVSPELKAPFDQELLAQGREIHEMNCAECHSSPKWAFAGYAAARMLRPIASWIDSVGSPGILWYVHILACFIGLAYLPFTKMFHIISTPVSLLANAVMQKGKSNPANIATRQVMELDACTHCGTCSLRCSAVMAFEALGNEYILPSEKMVILKRMARGKDLSDKEMRAVREGVCLCTNCDRCTVVCPSGINLKDLWFNVREDLIQRGDPEPLLLSQLSFVRGLNHEALAADTYSGPLDTARQAAAGRFDELMDKERPLALEGTEMGQPSVDNTYAYCFGCQNCTAICPVVGSYENPEEALGLLPHQIMCCLGLGLVEMASGPRMIWDCLTCYQCQEYCPQDVKICDLFYELKNMAKRGE